MYPECIVQEMLRKSRPPQININNDYKKNFQGPEVQPLGLEMWGLLLRIQKIVAPHLNTWFF
jgi:hypothetical protein